MTRTTSDTLNLAADLIEERGWKKCGDWFGRGDGPLCVEGAIRAACQTTEIEASQLFGKVGKHVGLPRLISITPGREPSYYTSHLWVWNDHEPQSGADVVEVLRATALIESGRERETAEVSA